MADNTTLNTGTGGDVIAADDVAGVKFQRIKLVDGTLDSNAAIPGDATNGLDVDVTRVQGTVTVGDGGSTISVDDGAGSLTVDGSVSLAAAIPAGTNNIGDVDVLTLPGTAADGAAGLPGVAVVIAGYDGTNVQAIVTDATGRPTVNINGAVPITDNAGSLTVDGTVTVQDGGGVLSVDDNGSTLSVDDGAGSLTVDGTVSANPAPVTSGGLTPSMTISAATTNATSVKGSAGQVYSVYASNTNAQPRYLKLYNKATTPTVGSDTPVLVFLIPGNTAGAGFSLQDGNGFAFGTGIAFALTTGVATADTGAVAANELVINLGYK